MPVVITLARAAAPGNVPASLQPGQVAIDEFGGILYWRQSGGAVRPLSLVAPAGTLLGNAGSTGGPPTYLGAEQVLALTGAAPAASPTFTGKVTVPTLALTGAWLTPSYAVAVPVLGGTVAIAATTSVQILDPVLVLGSLTVTLPPSPADGQRIELTSTQNITVLTLSAPGTTIRNAPASLSAGIGVAFIYAASRTTWFRLR